MGRPPIHLCYSTLTSYLCSLLLHHLPPCTPSAACSPLSPPPCAPPSPWLPGPCPPRPLRGSSQDFQRMDPSRFSGRPTCRAREWTTLALAPFSLLSRTCSGSLSGSSCRIPLHLNRRPLRKKVSQPGRLGRPWVLRA